jgi:hypothetical protein
MIEDESPPTEEEVPESEPGSRRLARWFFLRILAIVYLIAFWSLYTQFEGLIGDDGIVPAAEFMERLEGNISENESVSWWQFPTITWLVGASSLALEVLAVSGLVLSGLLLIGIAPRLTLVLLWALYLSFFTISSPFLNFQWDILLLETSLLAIFYAPAGFRPRLREEPEPPGASVWLVRLLLFKLILCSGLVKFNSGDTSWQDLTALDFHFWSQPLPHALAWQAHNLPDFGRQAGVFLNHFIELCVPFLILFNPRGKKLLIWCAISALVLYFGLTEFSIIHLGLFGLAALLLGGRVWPGGADASMSRTPAALWIVGLMITIGLSGNYGFFHLLTVALCFSLFDDGALRRCVPSFLHRDRSSPFAGPKPTWGHQLMVILVALVVLPISGLKMFPIVIHEQVAQARKAARAEEGPAVQDQRILDVMDFAGEVNGLIGSYGSINRYGLFARMTKTRYELQIEGSHGGQNWTPYRFRYKPNQANDPLQYAGFHMPRLDWQMWFAALRPRCNQRWFFGLLHGLARGSNPIHDLLEGSPFEGLPPTHLRVRRFKAQFARADDSANEGPWIFEPASDYCRTVSKSELEKVFSTRRP